jgi:hypothetical protein
MNEESEVNEIERQINEAWACIQFGVKRVGPLETIVLDDQIAMAAIVKMDGWIKLCDKKNLRRVKKHFVKAYEAILRVPPRKYPNKLIGLSEECGVKSIPSYLGCPAICEQIYRGES